MKTKLILLEGLPSTGKSTNSRILLSQFERNGFKTRWYHEDSRPHPTSFFYEASLSQEEYAELLNTFPKAVKTLESVKMVRGQTINFDLLAIKWNHLNVIGSAVYDSLLEYDVWNFSLDKYMDVALEKWAHFANQVGTDEVIILDSSFFQFQIYTFLLENAGYAALESFIKKLSEILSGLHPTLIYLYRNNVEDTLTYLETHRGVEFLERIWNRDKHLPYYSTRPYGVEGYREFLRDYHHTAGKLFQTVPFEKLSIEISGGRWRDYEISMLNHFNLKQMPEPCAILQYGTYTNHQMDLQIVVDGLWLTDPSGKRKRLFPKSANEFYIEDLPVILYFENPEKLTVKGQQLCERWTATRTEFLKTRD